MQRLALASCSQVSRAILVVDVVESVTAMAHDELGAVQALRAFFQRVRQDVLPRHSGRWVHSLGDGFIAEFDSPARATAAALELHKGDQKQNAVASPLTAARGGLRAAVHSATLIQTDEGLFGQGIQLARSLTELARPGDTVVTESAIDGIVEGIDAHIEDLGERRLQGWPNPIRLWRIERVHRFERTDAPSATSGFVFSAPLPPSQQPKAIRPTIAVLTFEQQTHQFQELPLGDLLAEQVINRLKRHKDFDVIARLSTTRLQSREWSVTAIGKRLDADYVLSGSIAPSGTQIEVVASMIHVSSGEKMWHHAYSAKLEDLIAKDSSLGERLSTECTQAIMHIAAEQALVLPLPRLSSNTLLLGAISLMHRSSRHALTSAGEILKLLAQRHRQSASPWAWQAKLQIIRAVQGMDEAPALAFQSAIDATSRALDLEPDNPTALALRGHALGHLGRDVGEAQALIEASLQREPNDPMAWLYLCMQSYLWGDSKTAVEHSGHALALSPLDPHRYYFLMQHGSALWVNERLEEAVLVCKESISANAMHASAYRVLIAALHAMDRTSEARDYLNALRILDPDLTVERYIANGSDSAVRRSVAEAMKAAGLPLH